MNNWKVYRWACKTTSKVYIGITQRSIKQRSRLAMSGYNGCTAFWHAIEKYGEKDFIAEILHDRLSKEEACRLEKEEIREYDCIAPKGYNLRSGGIPPEFNDETRGQISKALKGRKFSDEHRRKISEAKKGEKHPNFGKHRSAETRQKISEGNKGKIVSSEARRNISEALSGENNPNYGLRGKDSFNFGRKASDKARQNMSKAQSGKTLSEGHKKKMSDAKLGDKNPMYGKAFSDEHRRKLSESKKGRKRSAEARRNISESKKGDNNPMRRQRLKREWMYVRTVAMFLYECRSAVKKEDENGQLYLF